ncbi:MAG: ABC transporter [Candidatus Epulonipiscioides saccharophilum]|nr:MAG: ABC transporter [Epulopiscium sp. AS2M-Bin001]
MEISTQNLRLEIDSKTIIENINIRANNKKFIGIIGPNGSGKSTLLKCIYRVLKPSSGTVFLDNQSLNSIHVKESSKKLSVVSQHNFYNFDFTIEEVVIMGRTPHKRRLEADSSKDFEIVDNCLKKVGMYGFKGRSFNTLSGGEQQRIILARALAQETPSLILDEPTNHLDIKYQLQLLDIVKSLDITILSAIHDLNMATMYCDYIYAMKNGSIILEGTPKEVITAENIREIFEVFAKVYTDEWDRLNIVYYPEHVANNLFSPSVTS